MVRGGVGVCPGTMYMKLQVHMVCTCVWRPEVQDKTSTCYHIWIFHMDSGEQTQAFMVVQQTLY